MLRRLLFLILALVAGYIWFRRLWGSMAPARRDATRSARSGGERSTAMVRDRVCNTFLPRSRALRVTLDDGEHFFCSEACRSKFLDRRRGNPGATVSGAADGVPDPTH